MVLISPFARSCRSGKISPKNYPHWDEVIHVLKRDGIETVQIGKNGEPDLGVFKAFNLSFKEIRALIDKCEVWISVDNFLQHMIGPKGKPGIVLWGPSNPNIYGYSSNLNLYADEKGFRRNQFDMYENVKASNFVEAKVVIGAILNKLKEGD